LHKSPITADLSNHRRLFPASFIKLSTKICAVHKVYASRHGFGFRQSYALPYVLKISAVRFFGRRQKQARASKPMEMGNLSRGAINRRRAVCGIFPNNDRSQKGRKASTRQTIQSTSDRTFLSSLVVSNDEGVAGGKVLNRCRSGGEFLYSYFGRAYDIVE
jgi:hypothetical protein